MQFVEKLAGTNPVLAILLMMLFLFADIMIVLDAVRVSSRYFGSEEKLLQCDPVPVETSAKSKLKRLLSVYALAFAAVAYYFLQFFIWNHQVVTKGIGLFYVALFVLILVSLLLLASAVLNKIRITYRSSKMLAANLIVDVALLVVLHALCFWCC
jgi:hypothetical protein